jgi:hypothetical protein
VEKVVQALADLYGLDRVELVAQTMANFETLFRP